MSLETTDTMSQEPILIVGSGAMACLFGARLAPQRPVHMLASWPEGVTALRKIGIREKTANGWQVHPVEVFTDPDKIKPTRFALVLVKAWQTARAGEQLNRCLSEDGLALTLQNGLGNRETLTAALGPSRTALGVTTYGATMLAPGTVRPAGEGVVELGMVAGLDELASWLRQAGFEVREADDVQALAWGKLAINAGINPLTALTRSTNGFVREQPDARWLLEEAVQEVIAVADAIGVRLPQADPVAATLEVARRTADNRSSMLQDLERGAPTEIDAICGAVVQKGQAANTPTPINHALWRLVRAAAASEGGTDDRE